MQATGTLIFKPLRIALCYTSEEVGVAEAATAFGMSAFRRDRPKRLARSATKWVPFVRGPGAGGLFFRLHRGQLAIGNRQRTGEQALNNVRHMRQVEF